jgi:hypothetical protein
MWQLYEVSIEYFAYSVVSEVSLVKVYNIEPPAFSLCIPYIDLIDLKPFTGKFHHNKSDYTSDWRSAGYKYVQENVPVSDLFDMTPELETWVSKVWIREEDSYNILTGTRNVDFKKFIRDDFVCYRLVNPHHLESSHPNNSHYFYLKSHQVTYGKRGGGIMGLRLQRKSLLNHVSRAIVFLHPIDMFPRGDRDYALFLSSDSFVFDDNQTFWTISWSRTIQVSLEPPFVTNCRNNQELGFENKEHCQHECVSHRTMARFNQSIFTMTFIDPLNVTVLSSESLLTNKTLKEIIDGFITECNDSCWGHNCIRVNFMPIVTSTLKDSESIVFQVYDQNSLETRITFQPKLPFVSFLVYILSIIGFWFGISCLDLFHGISLLGTIRKNFGRRKKGVMRRKSTIPFNPRSSLRPFDGGLNVTENLYLRRQTRI